MACRNSTYSIAVVDRSNTSANLAAGVALRQTVVVLVHLVELAGCDHVRVGGSIRLRGYESCDAGEGEESGRKEHGR